jgi:hypothetical protein
MKHPGRVEDYLEHITEAIARAASYRRLGGCLEHRPKRSAKAETAA